jgi:hypothetical protein
MIAQLADSLLWLEAGGESVTDIEFKASPKTPRLFRDITITEKIDGTNACVIITEDGRVAAQSRNRLITPPNDNAGFAAWVHENEDSLTQILGFGRHYGEWWGYKIGRKYDMESRRFSLFNVDSWMGECRRGGDGEEYPNPIIGLRGGSIDAVPVLYRGPFSEYAIFSSLHRLRDKGSVASPGFMSPEGICVYHSQTRSVFKVTLDNQDRGKWEAAA